MSQHERNEWAKELIHSNLYLDDGGKDFYGGHGWHVELDGNTFKVLRTDLVG